MFSIPYFWKQVGVTQPHLPFKGRDNYSGLVVSGLNLGGSVEPVYNAVSIIELAADKGAQKILIPVSARKQLFDLPDDPATKVTVVYYADAKDALLKALSE